MKRNGFHALLVARVDPEDASTLARVERQLKGNWIMKLEQKFFRKRTFDPEASELSITIYNGDEDTYPWEKAIRRLPVDRVFVLLFNLFDHRYSQCKLANGLLHFYNNAIWDRSSYDPLESEERAFIPLTDLFIQNSFDTLLPLRALRLFATETAPRVNRCFSRANGNAIFLKK